jgi:cytoskeletal protein RodZ
MTDFGASFKKARQAMGLSIDQVSRETRISTRFLQAIENEEFHLLPGGIFNRGFVKAYAERIGLDTDQVIADYERLIQPEIQEPPEQALEASPSIPEKSAERYLYPIALGVLILLILIYYLLSRDSGPNAEMANELPVVSQPVSIATPPAPVNPNPQPATPEPPSALVNPAPQPAPAAESASGEPLIVELQIRETTWIKVSTDGSPATGLEGETLEPGSARRFTARGSIDLVIGNAGGVSLNINGLEVQRLGGSGRVREFKITPQNFRNIVGN